MIIAFVHFFAMYCFIFSVMFAIYYLSDALGNLITVRFPDSFIGRLIGHTNENLSNLGKEN